MNTEIFKHSKVGRGDYRGLMHSNGRPYSDIEYFELLGRRAEELDKLNNTRMPTNYGNYDRDVIAVAKQVVKALDEGYSHDEINHFLKQCIVF